MSRSDRILLAAGGAALVLAMAAAWVLVSPELGVGASDEEAAVLLSTPSPGLVGEPSGTPEPKVIVVDVEGAVLEPGIRELPGGARVADAIAAAGGYAPDVDLEAAAATINLAQRLVDGAQIIVPRVGAGSVAGGNLPREEAPDDDGGLVNLNTASAEELDSLPGIGPVTVERIIDARADRPFASLEEAVERGVIDRGQLKEIEGLATAE